MTNKLQIKLQVKSYQVFNYDFKQPTLDLSLEMRFEKNQI